FVFSIYLESVFDFDRMELFTMCEHNASLCFVRVSVMVFGSFSIACVVRGFWSSAQSEIFSNCCLQIAFAFRIPNRRIAFDIKLTTMHPRALRIYTTRTKRLLG